MRIILYGKCDNDIFSRIPSDSIIAILEGTENMTCPIIQLPIISKSELPKCKYDYILIGGLETGEKYIELLRQLHVEECKIRTVDDLLCERYVRHEYSLYYNEICLDGIRQDGRKRVLIVSHDMSASGAPIALLEFARTLKSMGYQVILYCQCSGPLIAEFIGLGIPVHVEDLDSRPDLYFWLLKNDFSFAVVNTLLQYKLVQKLSATSLKVFWWLHECDNYYQAILDIEGCLPTLNEFVVPLFVGNKVEEAFKRFYKRHIESYNLLYCIPDRTIAIDQQEGHGKVVFALIGAIVFRKGQDIFLQAIEQLDADPRERCEFWIIGDSPHEGSQLLSLICAKESEFPEVKYFGPLPYSEMQNLYRDIDVVVCPSRIDPMPVVVTEGFMNGKLCLVSDSIGTAQFIQNGINGFTFLSEDVLDLTEKMENIVRHLQDMTDVAREGYKVYKQYFTQLKFRENVSDIINKFVERNQ